jgi:hypothetical protein
VLTAYKSNSFQEPSLFILFDLIIPDFRYKLISVISILYYHFPFTPISGPHKNAGLHTVLLLNCYQVAYLSLFLFSNFWLLVFSLKVDEKINGNRVRCLVDITNRSIRFLHRSNTNKIGKFKKSTCIAFW